MSTSPVDPEDIRAAAEVYQELGPEYHDAVVAAFLDKVDRAVAARVEARLAEARVAPDWERQPAVRDGRRRTVLKGVALGVCASALVAGIGISHVHADIAHGQAVKVVPAKPGHAVFKKGPAGLAAGAAHPGAARRVSQPPVERPPVPPPPAG